MFVSPNPIPNIELLSQSIISSLESGSFGRNQSDMNIQHHTTSEVSDIEIVMADDEELYTPSTEVILNLFASSDLSSHSSSDSAKYKCAWLKAKLFYYSILSDG